MRPPSQMVPSQIANHHVDDAKSSDAFESLLHASRQTARISGTTSAANNQCDTKEQQRGRSSKSRVTPPSTHSRKRLCP